MSDIPTTTTGGSIDAATCSGFCRDCGREHLLGAGDARRHARELMSDFARLRRLDLLATDAEADPLLSFDHLFPGEPGNMFGVLECVDARGRAVVLRAFSSLRRGIRDVPGWVPPLLSRETFERVVLPEQRAIERLTTRIDALPAGSRPRARLRDLRRRRSRRLFATMQSHYRLRNFRGEERGLRDAFAGPGGIPGGVGECCAPKLLVHAARQGLRPVGLVEFYWGGTRGARRRVQGAFYPSCERRCRPILGFLLCGLDDAH
jgi:hypothetical protein